MQFILWPKKQNVISPEPLGFLNYWSTKEGFENASDTFCHIEFRILCQKANIKIFQKLGLFVQNTKLPTNSISIVLLIIAALLEYISQVYAECQMFCGWCGACATAPRDPIKNINFYYYSGSSWKHSFKVCDN